MCILLAQYFLGKAFFTFFLSSSVLARYGKFRDNQQVIEVKHVMIKNYRDNCIVRLTVKPVVRLRATLQYCQAMLVF